MLPDRIFIPLLAAVACLLLGAASYETAQAQEGIRCYPVVDTLQLLSDAGWSFNTPIVVSGFSAEFIITGTAPNGFGFAWPIAGDCLLLEFEMPLGPVKEDKGTPA